MENIVPSIEDIKTGFPFTQFDKIISEPMYNTLHKLEIQVTCNPITTEVVLLPLHNNLVGILEQPQVYLLHSLSIRSYSSTTQYHPSNIQHASQKLHNYYNNRENYKSND